MSLQQKYQKLQEIIKELGSIIIGFSGGVDSTLLAKVAYDILGEDVLAVTATAAIYSPREIKEAKRLGEEIGIDHQVVKIDDELMDIIKDNPTDRCYHCKTKIFSEVKKIAAGRQVVDGTNLDDLGEYRPGLKAIEELGIRSPLKEAGLTKKEIRELSKKLGLSTWNMPSFTCLATRFPYGEEITEDKLEMVEKAEIYLSELGFEDLRVRHHGEIARIEVALEERKKFFSLARMDQIADKLKEIGFTYVSLDLAGYRSGSNV